MSEEPRKIAGVPLTSFVKGGSTTAAWDAEKKRFYKEAETRRAHQDHQREGVRWAAGRQDAAAGLLSLQLSGQGNPKVCLIYKGKDSALDQHCLCEVAITGPEKMLLALVCPKCLERTQRMEDSQVIIRSEHRTFWLDPTRAALWVDPQSGLSYQLAGTITTADLLSCSALGCDWKFRIDNSELFGSHHFAL